MKTSYYLVTAAGLAAATIVYTQYRKRSGPGDVPAPVQPLAAEPTTPPPFKAAGALPIPVVPPPDARLVIPASATLPDLPVPPIPASPVVPLPDVPAPSLPVPPSVPAVPLPESPAPVIPVDPVALPPVVPMTPATPPAKVEPPVIPPLPVPIDPTAPAIPSKPPVVPPPASVLPQPAPLPVPAPKAESSLDQPRLLPDAPALNPTGKYVVLQGNRLVEASVAVTGDKAVLRQGSFDRTVPKADVLFVAETKDEVRQFMLAKVKPEDAAGRLGVARWLMFAGLREEAIAEAREVLKLQPRNTAAAEMVRSLEESLKAFPGDGKTQVVAAKPEAGTLTTVEPEADVTAEGATTFSARAQPVLANQCMECHARADHAGTFKLIRVTGFEVGPQSTKANLRATAAQLKKDDPLNSPLLAKALVAHGGMKQPAFVSRNAPAFRALEAWVLYAVGPVIQPMAPPVQPVVPPVSVTPPVPPMPVPVPPAPVEPVPAPPVPLPVPTPAVPVPVPPAIPPAIPPIPPAVSSVPPVLPTPPSIPPADDRPKVAPPAPPAIPPIPPAASLPKPPGGVQPAGGVPAVPAPKSQFGTTAPSKAPPAGPTGGDEFDPDAFNKGK